MAAHSQPRLTPEEYLELDRASEFRNEYYNGRMYAMSGGTHPHAIIIGNFIFELKNSLGKRPCIVTASDVRVRVTPSGLFTYPDVVVVCGEPKLLDGRRDTLLNPLLIVEVLSPSTEAYDRGFKFAQYRTLASLQEYVLVSQAEPRVEVYRRQPNGDWLLSEATGIEAVCRLASVECGIPLAAVYDKFTFDADEPFARPPQTSQSA